METIDRQLSIIKDACEEKNGSDIEVIEVKAMTTIADYFVIVSGNSTIQTKAIARAIDEDMYEEGYIIQHKEGYERGNWILLQYEGIIIHIFHKDEREYYDIERLWIQD